MNRYIRATFNWSFAKAIVVAFFKTIKFLLKMCLVGVTMVIVGVPMIIGFFAGLIWHSFKATFDASYDYLGWLGK